MTLQTSKLPQLADDRQGLLESLREQARNGAYRDRTELELEARGWKNHNRRLPGPDRSEPRS